MIKLVKHAYAGDNARILHLGPHTLYFSYETLIAFISTDGGFQRDRNPASVDGKWSTTTLKHMRSFGTRELPQLSDEAFALRVNQTLGGSFLTVGAF